MTRNVHKSFSIIEYIANIGKNMYPYLYVLVLLTDETC